MRVGKAAYRTASRFVLLTGYLNQEDEMDGLFRIHEGDQKFMQTSGQET